MKVKVVGCELREGDFNGNHYKNYMIYTVSPAKRDNEVFGVCPQTVKVKGKFIEDNNINIKSLNQKLCEFYYDSYGNIAKIDIEE